MASRRVQQLEQVAYELGLDFTPTDEWSTISFLRDFQLFGRGHSKKITNMLSKRDEWLKADARIFDYRFVISTGKTHRRIRQTVFFMHSKQLALPQFLMKPENIFHRIGDWLGLSKDIDFEEYPAFSDQYLLKGPDEDYIRYSMKDEVLKFFTIEKNWSLEGVNYYLIFYRKGKLLPPPQIKIFYTKGMEICRMLSESPSK